MALACVACSAADATSEATVTVSRSKLGVQIMASANDPAAEKLTSACPRVAKWILPATGAAKQISQYKQRCAGAVVVRVFVSRAVRYTTAESAAWAADDFWSRMQSDLATVDANDVDWLEGPNELDNVPNWCLGGDGATWFATFWSRLADDMSAAGFRPLVGSIAPRCAAHSAASLSEAFAPTAQVMKHKPYTWGWSYHAYSTALSHDLTEEAYPLGYRKVRNDCGLRGFPIVISEAGALVLGLHGASGWLGGDISAAEYMDWLEWYDARLKEDPAVIGATLYQVGNHGTFATYDLAPLAPQLAAYLRK